MSMQPRTTPQVGRKQQRGQSLISMMVGLVISLITIAAMMTLYKTMVEVSSNASRSALRDGQVSAALLSAQMELQSAGFGVPVADGLNSKLHVREAGKELVWRYKTELTASGYVCSGLRLVDGNLGRALVKVSAVDTVGNTFAAEDQNSTGYGTFASGNMQVVTLATEIGDGTGFTISGFDQQFAEYNLLRDRITRKIPTNVSAGSIEIPMLWDPTDATAQAIRTAADTAAKIGFKVVFPDGLEMLFFGYIGSSGMPRVDNNNAVIMTNVSISMATRPRYVLP